VVSGLAILWAGCNRAGRRPGPAVAAIDRRGYRATVLGPAVLALITGCGGGGGSGYGGSGSGGGTSIVLGSAQAVWLDRNTIVWPGVDAGHSYKLYYSAQARLVPASNDIAGEDNTGGDALTVGSLTATQLAAFPQYANATALTVPASTAAQISTVLKDQLAVVQYSDTTPTNGTQVQVGPVLDSVYGAAAANAMLGLSFDPLTDTPTFRLWAPTASAVKLNVYPLAGAVGGRPWP
jgi:hypothetical protein